MKLFRGVISVLLLSVPVSCFADLNGKVVRVLDGDTVEILSGQQKTRVRLNGIDAPEKKQPFGQRSKQYLAGMIGGKEVLAAGNKTDVYGRLLATVILDNQDINAILVYAGMAWAYRYKGRYTVANYGEYEQGAKAEKRGLWAQSDAVNPAEWRKRNVN